MPKAPRTNSKALSREDALIYVMVAVSAVDRVMSDAELSSIGLIVKRMPAFEGFDERRLIEVSKACAHALSAEHGLERTLEAIAKVLPGLLGETAYALAVEVAVADRNVNLEEVRLLDMLAERFQLDDLITAAIKRAAMARYRYL
jgi:tellurite resistance protein